jgi:hypothetical protein
MKDRTVQWWINILKMLQHSHPIINIGNILMVCISLWYNKLGIISFRHRFITVVNNTEFCIQNFYFTRFPFSWDFKGPVYILISTTTIYGILISEIRGGRWHKVYWILTTVNFIFHPIIQHILMVHHHIHVVRDEDCHLHTKFV